MKFRTQAVSARRYAQAGLLALVLWGVPAQAAEEAAPTEMPRAAPPEKGFDAGGRPALQMGADFGLGTPTPAITSFRPIGEVESRGIRFAPFTVRGAVIAGIGYDDNIALASTNKIGSMLYTLSPSVSVGLEGARHRYHAIYRGNYGRYASSSEDNYQDHNFTLVALDNWNARFRSFVQYDFLRGHSPRGASRDTTTFQDRWNWQSLRAAGFYGAEDAKGRLEARTGLSGRRYKTTPPGVVVDTRGYDQFDLGGAFSYRVGPRTRAGFEIDRADITHDGDPSLDSVEMHYSLGATWEALAKTRGRVKIGFVTKDFSDASRPDYSGPSYELGLTWSPRSYSNVDASIRRFLTENTESAGVFSVATAATLSWSHSWTERTRTSFSYSRTHQDQKGLGRTEIYSEAGVRVSYALRRWLRVGAEIRHDTRDSDLPGFDFTRNLTIFTVESAL